VDYRKYTPYRVNKLLQQGLEEKHQGNKDKILEFLMSLARYVKMEDLRVGERIFTSNKPKENCLTCHRFANIHCMNCQNVWLCIDDWKEHWIDKHE
jgi:hypothetical protein